LIERSNDVKKIVIAGGLFSALALSSWAYAGWVSQYDVYIGSYYANGSLYGARNSSDPYNAIACHLYGYPDDSEFGYCTASRGNEYKSCSVSSGSYGAAMRDTIRSITPASSIFFSVNSADSSCTAVYVTNASWSLP
jgi:hypothetical protein